MLGSNPDFSDFSFAQYNWAKMGGGVSKVTNRTDPNFLPSPIKYWQDECHFSATPLHCKYQPFIAFLLRNFKKLQKNAKKSNFLPHFLLRGRVGKFGDFFEKKQKN